MINSVKKYLYYVCWFHCLLLQPKIEKKIQSNDRLKFIKNNLIIYCSLIDYHFNDNIKIFTFRIVKQIKNYQ